MRIAETSPWCTVFKATVYCNIHGISDWSCNCAPAIPKWKYFTSNIKLYSVILTSVRLQKEND